MPSIKDGKKYNNNTRDINKNNSHIHWHLYKGASGSDYNFIICIGCCAWSEKDIMYCWTTIT